MKNELEILREELNLVRKDIDDGLDWGGPAPRSLYERARELEAKIKLLSDEETK
jgi:hypothetical protein